MCFWASLFNFLNYFVSLRITDEGSVPEIRILMVHIVNWIRYKNGVFILVSLF